jgi:hypothetical protein
VSAGWHFLWQASDESPASPQFGDVGLVLGLCVRASCPLLVYQYRLHGYDLLKWGLLVSGAAAVSSTWFMGL